MAEVDATTRWARAGMVASADHLASSAGVAMLRAGGSAGDAAVAAAAVMAVVGPHLCGMGGDLFALVHHDPDAAPATLNASGRAGSGADADRLLAEGHTTIPMFDDVRSAPVPGCVDGWLALHERFGLLSLGDVLAPAIDHADGGFPASPLLALAAPFLNGVAGADDLVADGRRKPGDIVRRPGVARALRAIVDEGRAGFYQGEFGAGLLALGAGEYSAADLDQVQADWVAPLCVDVWGHRVWTIPPNSQGYLILLGAAIAEGLVELPDDPAEAAWSHLLVEASRAAGHDRPTVLHEHADVVPMLVPEAVAARRALIDPDHRAHLATPAALGDTTYMCAVDANRMGVSLIQSNAFAFGSRVFEPATGIGLHNRGIGFSLIPDHPARYGPRRRPPHTLSPTLVTTNDGILRTVLGTMGGDAQPQIVLQLLTRLLRHEQAPGQAIAAPRWALRRREGTGFDAWVEPDATVVDVEDAGWVDGLRARGHDVAVSGAFTTTFGHAHMIDIHDRVLAGAADPRALVGAAQGL